MSERQDRPRLGRKGNRKVRTGCRTCKTRKVKCDETKPHCLRCTSSGRVCGGYPPVPPRTSRRVPVADGSTPSGGSGSGSGSGREDTGAASRTGDFVFDIDDNDDDDGDADADDEHDLSGDMAGSSGALDRVSTAASGQSLPSPSLLLGDGKGGVLTLFHRRTGPKLTTFTDLYFWKELVLQMGDAEPAVRHALSAVNSIYDYIESRRGAPTEPEQLRLKHPAYSHGIREYNRSMKALVHRSNQAAVDGGGGGGGDDKSDLHLVCCILFVCIEMMGNERATAMDHFDQGLKLLSNYTSNKPSSAIRTDVVRDVLAPIFRRLSLQANLMGRRAPKIPLFNQIYSSYDVRKISSFQSIAEASHSLVAIMDDGLRLAHDVLGLDNPKSGLKYDRERWGSSRKFMESRRDVLIEQLNKWLDAFSPYAATAYIMPTDPKERYGTCMLKMHHLISMVWVYGIIEDEESAYDTQNSAFATLLHYASELLMMEKMSQDPAADTVFTFEMGVIAPLYFVITKCRQRRIRRAGLHLLEKWPRRENIWDPEQIARIVRRIVLLEDPGVFDLESSDDVFPPEWKRVHRCDFEFFKNNDGSFMTLALMHRKPLGLDAEWEVIREIISGADTDSDCEYHPFFRYNP